MPEAQPPLFTLHPGHTPLLISMPHVGTALPPALHSRYAPRALDTEDTDWHLAQLYAFAKTMGASMLEPRHSRYLVDLNRPPENTPMYVGSNNTELCPTHFFTGEPLYRDGQAPSDTEIAQRVTTYWRPYHQALQDELQRLKATHGYALLFDAHSIKSELPWLFEGQLPALNLGTANGQSCAPALRDAMAAVCAAQTAYSHVVDGRFKGGYITRQYGRPADGIHVVQLEMCWRCYMEECPPYAWNAQIAGQVQPLLKALLQAMIDWKPHA